MAWCILEFYNLGNVRISCSGLPLKMGPDRNPLFKCTAKRSNVILTMELYPCGRIMSTGNNNKKKKVRASAERLKTPVEKTAKNAKIKDSGLGVGKC